MQSLLPTPRPATRKQRRKHWCVGARMQASRSMSTGLRGARGAALTKPTVLTVK